MSLANNYLSQLYVKNKMNDPRFPHAGVEVPVKEKTHKYKRFQHEKRAKRTPGTKRVESPHIMVTKWDVEKTNTRNKKVGRKRERDEKYGDWGENRTDAAWEDKKNETMNKQVRERLRVAALERRGVFQRKAICEYADLLFPIFYLKDKSNWPTWAWESYYEQKEMGDAEKFEAMRGKVYHEFIDEPEELSREEYYQAWHDILNSPEQLAINAANDAHNAQQGHIEGDLYEVELETDSEAESE